MANSEAICILWRLPQELLDMVFDFAYPAVENLEVTRKATWDFREERKRRTDENYRSAPWIYGIDQFLISKRFFTNAIRAWVSSQHWLLNDSNMSAFGRCSVFEEYATEYATYASDLIYITLERMPRLKYLRLKVSPDHCLDEMYKMHGYAWTTRIPRTAFRDLAFVKQIADTNSIRSVEIVTEYCSYAGDDPIKVSHWQENMEELGKAIKDALHERDQLQRNLPPRQQISNPRQDTSPCSPLVTGSRVCSSCSDFHSTPLIKRHKKRVSGSPSPSKGFEPLTDADIPDSQVEILRMVNEQPSRVAHWIWKTKKGLQK